MSPNDALETRACAHGTGGKDFLQPNLAAPGMQAGMMQQPAMGTQPMVQQQTMAQPMMQQPQQAMPQAAVQPQPVVQQPAVQPQQQVTHAPAPPTQMQTAPPPLAQPTTVSDYTGLQPGGTYDQSTGQTIYVQPDGTRWQMMPDGSFTRLG